MSWVQILLSLPDVNNLQKYGVNIYKSTENIEFIRVLVLNTVFLYGADEMIVWLDKNIFEWQINGSIGCYNAEDIQSCYDYLEYAESLIENFYDKFHIQDCIKNLKCVVDKRIKQIERIYNFKSYFPNQHILEIYKK